MTTDPETLARVQRLQQRRSDRPARQSAVTPAARRPQGGRDRHPARAARVAATGLGATATLGLVAVIGAQAAASDEGNANALELGTESGIAPGIAPTANAATPPRQVIIIVHRANAQDRATAGGSTQETGGGEDSTAAPSTVTSSSSASPQPIQLQASPAPPSHNSAPAPVTTTRGSR